MITYNNMLTKAVRTELDKIKSDNIRIIIYKFKVIDSIYEIPKSMILNNRNQLTKTFKDIIKDYSKIVFNPVVH